MQESLAAPCFANGRATCSSGSRKKRRRGRLRVSTSLPMLLGRVAVVFLACPGSLARLCFSFFFFSCLVLPAWSAVWFATARALPVYGLCSWSARFVDVVILSLDLLLLLLLLNKIRVQPRIRKKTKRQREIWL
jgi:hypothetical protein